MSVISHRIYGSGDTVIYILHGIFGMKDNWHYIAGQLSDAYTVVTIDARNHGKSFHSFEMSYRHMADDLEGLMEHLGHSRAWVMGHSMGGKTAMTFSEHYPEKLQGLIVVDIGVKAYKPGHIPYFEAFENIDFTSLQSRSEADQAFAAYAPEPEIRQFLLKNLEPLAGCGYQPRFNLPAIKTFYLQSIGSLALPQPCWTSGPAIFITGENSRYVLNEDHAEIKKYYPQAIFKSISRAGHWVHADNPADFLDLIRHLIPA